MAVYQERGNVRRHPVLSSIEVNCSWCCSRVPLPAGDYSGVCIECGTVVFRPFESLSCRRMSFSERNTLKNLDFSFMPQPAV